MKKYLPILSIAFLAAACSGNPTETETKTLQSAQQQSTAPTVDTAGLAQFQQWKAQNELSAATEVQQQEQPVAQAPVRTVTVVREVRVQQPAPARRTVRQQSARVQQRPAPVESSNHSSAGSDDVASTSGAGGTTTAEAPAPQQETAKNDGWSGAKKGAVIGSAGGAVVGAVLNKKNRAVGAVIGGVLGGAVGYGIGKKKDNKEAQQ